MLGKGLEIGPTGLDPPAGARNGRKKQPATLDSTHDPKILPMIFDLKKVNK